MADNKTKRRVKNPETFRERAIKAAVETDKPGKRSVLKQTSGRFIKPVTQPAGQAARSVVGWRPVQLLSRPFRFIGRIIFPAYFRNSWQELRLVSWPSWQESRRLTYAVLIFAVIFGATIALVDYGLDKIFRSVLLK
jgi:preprotein translocase SecE subunit